MVELRFYTADTAVRFCHEVPSFKHRSSIGLGHPPFTHVRGVRTRHRAPIMSDRRIMDNTRVF